MIEKVESLIETAESKKAANEWGLARIDYLKALEILNQCEKEDSKVKDYLNKIKLELETVNQELAKRQFQKGKNAVENGLWKNAIDCLEEATRLAKIDDVAFLEEIKNWLDKAKIADRDSSLKINIDPFISRGNDFKHNRNFGEAIVEFQAAAKIIENLPDTHPYHQLVKNLIIECRRSIVRPYLRKSYKLLKSKKYVKAVDLLKRALFLVDNNDKIYYDFILGILKNAESNVDDKELNDTDEFESQELWDKAVKDYEEALNLYSSYIVTDPFAPAYNNANIYEDKFAESRKQLGKLYKKRADHLKNNGKVEKAISNYKEALKLLPKTDKLFFETFNEMKNLRIQVNIPEK